MKCEAMKSRNAVVRRGIRISVMSVAVAAACGAAHAQTAVALDPGSIASGWWSTAGGDGAKATNGLTTAIGGGAYAFGYESTAVGGLSEARGDYSAAFGSALAFGQGTTALGTWAYAGGGFTWGADGRPDNIVEVLDATAVGFSSAATANGATALGADAHARGINSIAIGHNANVASTTAGADLANSVAIGNASAVSNFNDVAIGYANVIEGQSSTAIGQQNAITATAKTDAVQVLGNKNKVDSASSVNVQGTFNQVQQSYWVSTQGFSNKVLNTGVANVEGVGNTIVSDSVYANGNTNVWDPSSWSAINVTGNGNTLSNTAHTTVFGNLNTIQGGARNMLFGDGYSLAGSSDNFAAGYNNSLGSGVQGAQVLGGKVTIAGGLSNAVAIGMGTSVLANDSVAIGAGASASEASSVALGAGSTTAAVVATPAGIINGVTYPFAGAAPVGTVSVGAFGSERTFTNVAAGRITANSTDAVNGSQLFSFGTALEALGAKVATFEGLVPPPGTGLVGYTHGDDDKSTYGNGGPASTALGVNADAAGAEYAVAIGEDASVAADGGTAVGQAATAAGPNAVALGQGATAAAGNAVALGQGAAATQNAVALGQGATAASAQAVALGQGAAATAQNSVALGQGSVADRANTVSVGSQGNERQVTSVADGTQATDAVNKRQLDRGVATGVASANSYTDARVQGLSDSFDQFSRDVEGRLRAQDRDIDRQGAMSAAMVNMAVSAAGVRTPNRVGVGLGFQGGESALSVGYQRGISDRATFTVGGSFSSDEASVGVGAGFGW